MKDKLTITTDLLFKLTVKIKNLIKENPRIADEEFESYIQAAVHLLTNTGSIDHTDSQESEPTVRPSAFTFTNVAKESLVVSADGNIVHINAKNPDGSMAVGFVLGSNIVRQLISILGLIDDMKVTKDGFGAFKKEMVEVVIPTTERMVEKERKHLQHLKAISAPHHMISGSVQMLEHLEERQKQYRIYTNNL